MSGVSHALSAHVVALNFQHPDAEAAEVPQKSQKDFHEVFSMHNEPHLQSRMRVGCAARSGQVPR
jgi:hypothetical protein